MGRLHPLYISLVLMAYTWPYAILLPWRGPCAYTPLSLSNMRETSAASAPPSTDFQIAISTIGPFLSRVSMFPHSLLLPSFWFIKPSLLSYFLFPEFCLFFKTSYHIFLLTPEPNLNRVIIKI